MNRITTLCSLAILVLGACSKEKVRGLDMPELRLTAGIEAMTRATADNNAWTGGEQIAVEATSSTGGIQPEVKIYTAAADGTLTTDIPFEWTRDDERKRFRAWYCADGSSAAGGANAAAAPDKWAVKADQRGEGYAQSDLLFAATEVSYSDHVADPVPMKFYHQTSKVVVNIVKSEYATSAERISSVRIGGDLLFEASYVAPDAGGAMMGDWGSGGTRGTIEPRQLSAPSDPEQYVATYEALVIPQETAGQCLLTVETDLGTTLHYNAPADAQPFAPGKVSTYDVTVKVEGLEVDIVTVNSNAWTDSGSTEDIIANADPKIGDYFYSDGTWSDGGLRKSADGSIKIASPKPAPVLTNPNTGAARKVVGIVFQTDWNRIGAKEKEKLGGEGNVHGLVMAIKNAATGVTWGMAMNMWMTQCQTKAQNYNDISGYGNCEHIRSGFYFSKCPAIKAAYDYNTTCPVPQTTTGWYLPSSGQWWDIILNLGACPALADEKEQTSSDSDNFSWIDQGDVLGALDKWMEKIAIEDKDAFSGKQGFYWSSSECGYDYFARYWYVYDNIVSCSIGQRTRNFDVRPVLAF